MIEEIHPLKWSEVVKPKREEGLALGSLERKNWALLGKSWWRFGEERKSLWRKVTEREDGQIGGVRFLNLFLDIGCRESRVPLLVLGMSPMCSRGERFIVREGRWIHFWFDNWARVGPLHVLYHRVFRVLSNKFSSVSECYA